MKAQNIPAGDDEILDVRDIEAMLKELDRKLPPTSGQRADPRGIGSPAQLPSPAQGVMSIANAPNDHSADPSLVFDTVNQLKVHRGLQESLGLVANTLRQSGLPTKDALNHLTEHRDDERDRANETMMSKWQVMPPSLDALERESNAERDHLASKISLYSQALSTNDEEVKYLSEAFWTLYKQRQLLMSKRSDVMTARQTNALDTARVMHQTLTDSANLYVRKFKADLMDVSTTHRKFNEMIIRVRKQAEVGQLRLMPGYLVQFTKKYEGFLEGMGEALPAAERLKMGLARVYADSTGGNGAKEDTLAGIDSLRMLMDTTGLVDEELKTEQARMLPNHTSLQHQNTMLRTGMSRFLSLWTRLERRERERLTTVFRLRDILHEETRYVTTALTEGVVKSLYDTSLSTLRAWQQHVNALSQRTRQQLTTIETRDRATLRQMNEYRRRLVLAHDTAADRVVSGEVALQRWEILTDQLRDCQNVRQVVGWLGRGVRTLA